MPEPGIKGLSDIYRPPRVGMIRLGAKTISKGKEHPKALPYFRVPDEIKSMVGEQPAELNIYLPSSDPKKCFPQFYERWGGSKDPENARLLCQGNGWEADYSDSDGNKEIIDCPGERCEFFLTGKCRRVCRLLIVLPNVPGLGVWQINTGSWHGTIDINSMIDLLNRTLGRATAIPLKLVLQPKKVRPEGRPTVVFTMHLCCPGLSFDQARDIVRRQPAELTAPKALIERPDALVPVSARSDDGIPVDVEGQAEPSQDSKAAVEADREAAQARAEQNGQKEGAGVERVRRAKPPF